MPPLYLRVFLRLLIEANHQDNEIPYREKGQSVVGKKLIKRGERLTSVRDICKWVAWYERGCLKEPNPKTIQNILDWLEENNMIEIYGAKGNRKETLYTIVNYDLYQDKDSDKVTEKKQLGNSLETEKQQSLETNKNVKNVKNINKEYQKKYSDGSFEMKCVNYLINSIKSEMPSAKLPVTDMAIDKWCDHIEKMIRLDKRAEEDVYKVLVFARTDTFWKANIRSTSKFREKYETLYLQMKNKQHPKVQPKSANKFNQFPQRTYTASDYANIERKLINKGL